MFPVKSNMSSSSIFFIRNHGITTALFFVKGSHVSFTWQGTEIRLGMWKKPGLYSTGILGLMSAAIACVSSPGSGYTPQCVTV